MQTGGEGEEKSEYYADFISGSSPTAPDGRTTDKGQELLVTADEKDE